jgi:outer membrane scaffolding protein for murein synthesis (MipA/OmpV family)
MEGYRMAAKKRFSLLRENRVAFLATMLGIAKMAFQADLRLTAGVFQAGGFSAGLFGQATWANAQSTGSRYGISAQQAVISGLPAFETGSGLLSSSLGVIWSFDLADHWLLVGNLESRRLHGEAVQSPLTQRRSNYYATVGAAYRFGGIMR